MVGQVSGPVIPLTRDLKIYGDRFLLDFKGKRIVVLILINVLILMVPLHLFEVLDDLV